MNVFLVYHELFSYITKTIEIGRFFMRYRIFRQIVLSGNFTKAAEILNMTQSAVSHSISTLEKEIGFPLFIRNKSGILLTEEGKLLWDHVEDYIASEDRLYNQIHALNRLEQGTLRVGSFTSASSRFLPKILKVFDARYPHIEIDICDEDYDRIKKKLQNGLLDVGFLIEEYLEPEHYAIPCFKDEMVVVVPFNVEFQTMDSLPLKAIENYDFIMPDNDQDFFLKQMLLKNQVTPKIKYKFQLMSTVFSMVEAGLGITLVPDSTLLKRNHEVDMLSLEPPIYRTIYLVANKSRLKSPIVSAFFEVATNIK